MSVLPAVDYWVLGVVVISQVALVSGIVYGVRRFMKSRKAQRPPQA